MIPGWTRCRDRPEISPWRFSGKAVHHVDRGGEHDADAQADQEQAGGEVPGAGWPFTWIGQHDDANDGDHEPGHDRVPPGTAGPGGQRPVRTARFPRWRR